MLQTARVNKCVHGCAACTVTGLAPWPAAQPAGGIDDFVTLLLLLSQPEDFELLAVTILDADCLAALAANTTLKTLHAVGAGHVPVAVSTLPGVNPFPDVWRWHGKYCCSLMIFQRLHVC